MERQLEKQNRLSESKARHENEGMVEKYFNDREKADAAKRNQLTKQNAELLQQTILDRKLKEQQEKDADRKFLNAAQEMMGIEEKVSKDRNAEYARDLRDDMARREEERRNLRARDRGEDDQYRKALDQEARAKALKD